MQRDAADAALTSARRAIVSFVSHPPKEAFLNARSGTFSNVSREWTLSADQWSQRYYQLRERKLYLVENDNKEQQYEESELDIETFIREHAAHLESPYPEIVAFLTGTRSEESSSD
ncbi:MAG: hypothetical protein U0174_06520 [Polyangiaceae bacterium]